MPIVVVYSTTASPDEYDVVVSRIRFHDDPPAGLVVHTASVDPDGHMYVMDVWESKEACDRFVAGHLRPALREVRGDAYVDELVQELHDLHSLVRPLRRFRAPGTTLEQLGDGADERA